MSRKIGDQHANKLKHYFDSLRKTGERLPSRNEKPNITAIATACGFNREVLYQNQQCREMLESATSSIGLATCQTTDQTSANSEAIRMERRLTRLEQQNAALVAEVHELRSQLARYHQIEELTEAGRRVIP